MPFSGVVGFRLIVTSIQVFFRLWDAVKNFQAQWERDAHSSEVIIHKVLYYLWGPLTPFHSPEFTQSKSHALPGDLVLGQRHRGS